MKIYVTERIEFKTCRRRWYYSYRDGIAEKKKSPALFFGSAIHSGLANYYRFPSTVREPINMLVGWRDYLDKEDTDNQVTPEQWSLAEKMFKAYHLYAEKFDNFKVKSVEERFEVILKNPYTGALVPDVRVVGKMDLTAEAADGIWLWDHKTASSDSSYAGLEVDDQVTAYHYLYWRTHGIIPQGMVYNVVLKSKYAEPTVLKTGKLSKAVSQGTNYYTYLSTLRERGENPAEYWEILEKLKLDLPVKRYQTTRTLKELQSFEKQLYNEYLDIKDVRENPDKAYPNASAINCSYCPALSICVMQNQQEDYSWVLEQLYRTKAEEDERRHPDTRPHGGTDGGVQRPTGESAGTAEGGLGTPQGITFYARLTEGLNRSTHRPTEGSAGADGKIGGQTE